MRLDWKPLAAALCALVVAREARGDEPPGGDAKPAAPRVVELVVDSAPEPRPALRYHLLPPPEEQRRGNAAPIYLRIPHEKNDPWKDRLISETARLLDLPFEELPIDVAQQHLEAYQWVLDELAAAGRRTDCDWEYVLEERDPMAIHIPDAQSIRAYGRLLALQARVAVKRGDVPGAMAALQAGLALAQHAAEAPFIVNRLVAIAISGIMLNQVDLLLAQPGAPNLYWAAAELPRPLIGMRGAFPLEQQLLILSYPELQQPDDLSSADWQSLADKLRRFARELSDDSEASQVSKELITGAGSLAAPSSVAPGKRAAARDYLRDVLQIPAAQVAGMTEAEVEVRHTVALHRELIDQALKWFSLPTEESLPQIAERSQALLAEAAQRELIPLASQLVPSGATLLGAQSRVERRVARLQAIEALRMHAAATGQLPASLDEVRVVPVPTDPGTGRAFDYHLDGDTAVLDIKELSDADREWVPLPTRLRLSKR